jgi:hypothetical protein
MAQVTYLEFENFFAMVNESSLPPTGWVPLSDYEHSCLITNSNSPSRMMVRISHAQVPTSLLPR